MREDVGILRGALDEAHHRRVGIVRMMQEHVALAQQAEERGRSRRKVEFARNERREISGPAAASGRRG